MRGRNWESSERSVLHVQINDRTNVRREMCAYMLYRKFTCLGGFILVTFKITQWEGEFHFEGLRRYCYHKGCMNSLLSYLLADMTIRTFDWETFEQDSDGGTIMGVGVYRLGVDG